MPFVVPMSEATRVTFRLRSMRQTWPVDFAQLGSLAHSVPSLRHRQIVRLVHCGLMREHVEAARAWVEAQHVVSGVIGHESDSLCD